MKYIYILILCSLTGIDVTAQGIESPRLNENLPYHEIPEYPQGYTPETVAARMIDGLGFRYFWATQGLTKKDLEYKPSDEARSTAETIDHIHGLSLTIVNASLNKPNVFPRDDEELTFEQKRALTLLPIFQALR